MSSIPDIPEAALDQRLTHMRALFTAARNITLPLFHAQFSASDFPDLQINNKAEHGYDPVTNADIEAELVLRRLIQDSFPDDHIEGEEHADIIGRNDWLWTLDPIDGTRAFVAGVPVWSTLIALSYKAKPVLGLIDLPAQDAQFWGAPGRAWAVTPQGEFDLKTRDCPQLIKAVLGCTEPLAMFNAGERAAYDMIRRGVRFSRLGLDAFGYALVARGRMDIIIEAGLKPCDVRALMPVITGAGGVMTNWHGGSCVDGGQVVAVGDAALLPELYTYLGRAMTP